MFVWMKCSEYLKTISILIIIYVLVPGLDVFLHEILVIYPPEKDYKRRRKVSNTFCESILLIPNQCKKWML